ncbi:Uncharacterized protein HZ326_0782 [Fusarium oxysporum f. sp. albedinis]|nr:Uncharacterized protein HZ326_0782 [Fusarium oxysporum f. sp. albedinis]
MLSPSVRYQKPCQSLSRTIVDVCTRLLEEIQTVLLKYHALDDKNGKARKIWKRLRWEPDDVKDMRQRLTSNIVLLSTINDTLNGSRRALISFMTSMKTRTQHKDVLTRIQSGTGKCTLFCPGLPGGGKTVIAASIIDDLLYKFETEDRLGVALIYCSYKDSMSKVSRLVWLVCSNNLSSNYPRCPRLYALCIVGGRIEGNWGCTECESVRFERKR